MLLFQSIMLCFCRIHFKQNQIKYIYRLVTNMPQTPSESNTQITNSLIGFLAKKSLFSPTKKSSNQSKRGTSKDGKKQLALSSTGKKYSAINKVDIDSKSQISEIQLFRNHSQKQFDSASVMLNNPNTNRFFQKQKGLKEDNKPLTTSHKASPVRYEAGDRFNKRAKMNETKQLNQTKPTLKQQNTSRSIHQQNSFFNQQSQSQSHNQRPQQMFNSLANQNNTHFQSARVESSQCLEELSLKLHNQISNINYKIDMFNKTMSHVLNIEFKNLREKINQVVENVFKESERQIRDYMKQQEALLAKELLEMKTNLTRQYNKVEEMKNQIGGPGWRKVAGELLSSELEQRIQESLYHSKGIQISHWELGDLGGNKVVALENQLKDIVCLVR